MELDSALAICAASSVGKKNVECPYIGEGSKRDLRQGARRPCKYV